MVENVENLSNSFPVPVFSLTINFLVSWVFQLKKEKENETLLCKFLLSFIITRNRFLCIAGLIYYYVYNFTFDLYLS